jgi:hypothetical protein
VETFEGTAPLKSRNTSEINGRLQMLDPPPYDAQIKTQQIFGGAIKPQHLAPVVKERVSMFAPLGLELSQASLHVGFSQSPTVRCFRVAQKGCQQGNKLRLPVNVGFLEHNLELIARGLLTDIQLIGNRLERRP